MVLKANKIIRFEILFILYYKLILSITVLPESISYIIDCANILLLLIMFTNNKSIRRRLKNIDAKYFKILLFVSLSFIFVGCLVNFNDFSFLLFLWGARNLGRFILFFIFCICFLSVNDLSIIFKDLYLAYYINFILSLIQYFMGIRGDNLGGIFGTLAASNSFSINLLIIISSLTLVLYLNKQVSIKLVVAIMLISMVISALAELKLVFLLIAIMFIFSIALQRKISFRGMFLIIIGVFALIVGINILQTVFPESLSYLTKSGLLEYISADKGYGYASVDDLSRANALNQIHKMFFANNNINSVFGLGLGQCETSSFSFFNSSFFVRYEYLHYRWFFHATTYLELGVLGLLCYLFWFIGIFIYGYKKRSKINDNLYPIVCLSQMISLFAIILAMYNSSLRIESGYLLYFVMSMVLIVEKDKNQAINWNKIIKII